MIAPLNIFISQVNLNLPATDGWDPYEIFLNLSNRKPFDGRLSNELVEDALFETNND